MKAGIVKIKKDMQKMVDSLEDAQIYGVAEILNIALENVEEALNEYEEYEADNS
jgi:NADH:ubiquinone oxidoreductase subunit E